ncbi:MAG: ACT domain-containing protein [Bombilactobacillus mellifer]|nr:ACT domain-containing protein [Bombilactobacillus mellifer]
MIKIVITVIGKDKPGIIYKISQELAKVKVNILDVSQTIMQEMFTMMMLADISHTSVEFFYLKQNLIAIGKELGVQINVQREEIFNEMAKI